jgi:hypothetical protein
VSQPEHTQVPQVIQEHQLRTIWCESCDATMQGASTCTQRSVTRVTPAVYSGVERAGNCVPHARTCFIPESYESDIPTFRHIPVLRVLRAVDHRSVPQHASRGTSCRRHCEMAYPHLKLRTISFNRSMTAHTPCLTQPGRVATSLQHSAQNQL